MRLPCITLLVLTGPQLMAQTIDEHLAVVNAVFAGAVQMRMDKHDRLVIDFYDDGNHFRHDVVPLIHLDSTITFSPEEDAVVIACLPAYGQCIDKEIIKLNTMRPTGRSNLPRPSTDPEGARAIAAVRDLITAAHAQLADMPNETRERVVRRK